MTVSQPGVEGLVAVEIHKAYDGFTLGPMSLVVRPGCALGVLGANGAGKTTLLAGLAGQLRFDGGAVSWAGEPIVRGAWEYRKQVSYCRDIPALYGDLTVRQTLAFVARCHPTWDGDRAREWLDVCRLDPRKPVRALSRGMKAKLGLLLAAAHDVRLLVLDEVTAGIDPDTRDELQRLLRGLVTGRGVAVVISSHLFEDIEQVSDDVLILRNGTAAFAGSTDGVKQMWVAVLSPARARVLEVLPGVVRAWDVPDGRALLVATRQDRVLLEALGASQPPLRPASLRDLYFAFRDTSWPSSSR